ncbi:MAG: type IV pilus secretin PilQ [Chloracidobacterium sp.]|nr:type IV pilus secretin PilQ [Chloracidobacterium sp.]MCC6825451.1 type IV pilus secretin PilQ [Acidobacteriota bacterium]MCO5334426.1 type IV pilus secretin PilQ [Pyrinomonadaceae bacterium]
MNSLTHLREIVKRSAAVIMIALVVAVSAFSQTVDPRSQGLHYGDAGFRGEPINLSVVNADIRDILSYITDQYGINFVIDKSVKEVPVTVKLNDVPWNVALDSVLQSQALSAQVNGNILRIVDSKTLSDEIDVQAKLRDGAIDGSPLYTEFLRLNYARASGTLSGAAGASNQMTTGTSSMGGGGAMASAPSGSGAATSGGGADQGILGIVQKRLSRRGTVEVDGRSNTLIITDVRQNLDAIRQLVAYLDQPEPQVEIEARIVVATRNFSRDIGVQLGAFVAGPRGSAYGGGTLPNATTTIPVPGGYPVPHINNDLVSKIANTAIGLTTGVFGTAQLSALITAGEQKGEAKVIATPRVTALNNRPAEIKSGTKIPITTVQPGGADGGPVIQTTTYVDVPLRLAITPQITDLGTVILNVVAENSSTATIVGGAAPAINTQSMTTQVTVPDGGTTVVGGVLFDDERESQDRTPGLSRIPILGNLFKRKGVQRNTNEILFFITPRITHPQSPADQSSKQTKPAPILQPVPLGNPPSNSTRNPETPLPNVQTPVVARPDAVQGPGKP